jgi:hypothetical protein
MQGLTIKAEEEQGDEKHGKKEPRRSDDRSEEASG